MNTDTCPAFDGYNCSPSPDYRCGYFVPGYINCVRVRDYNADLTGYYLNTDGDGICMENSFLLYFSF
ncbi:unnamed protein product [Rotaria sp. Silwood1]|nr:unnamed protein product [Rotaria sp. Silwood1]